MKLKQRPACEVLERSQLEKSRVGRVKNGDIVLIPPYLLRDLHALRHIDIIMRHDNTNVIADGLLKARFWKLNLFDIGSYRKLFDKLDKVQAKMPNEIGIVQAICAA